MKVKITFEFGDNDIKPYTLTEEFADKELYNTFLKEANQLKKIDRIEFSFNEILKIVESYDAAIYWHENWPYHEHYGPAHIRYIKG